MPQTYTTKYIDDSKYRLKYRVNAEVEKYTAVKEGLTKKKVAAEVLLINGTAYYY